MRLTHHTARPKSRHTAGTLTFMHMQNQIDHQICKDAYKICIFCRGVPPCTLDCSLCRILCMLYLFSMCCVSILYLFCIYFVVFAHRYFAIVANMFFLTILFSRSKGSAGPLRLPRRWKVILFDGGLGGCSGTVKHTAGTELSCVWYGDTYSWYRALVCLLQ